jgi:hypothetical protein
VDLGLEMQRIRLRMGVVSLLERVGGRNIAQRLWSETPEPTAFAFTTSGLLALALLAPWKILFDRDRVLIELDVAAKRNHSKP